MGQHNQTALTFPFSACMSFSHIAMASGFPTLNQEQLVYPGYGHTHLLCNELVPVNVFRSGTAAITIPSAMHAISREIAPFFNDRSLIALFPLSSWHDCQSLPLLM